MAAAPRVALLLAGLLLAAGELAACASPVSVELDPMADLSGYRTWAWLPLAERRARPYDDEELDRLIRSSIERELGARGYAPASEGAPDFYVSYHVAIQKEAERYLETGATQTLSSMHDSPSYEVVTTEERTRIYETGTLAVDVAEPDRGALVWRGLEQRRVARSYKAGVEDAVAEILAHFPACQGRDCATLLD